jgi:hypothetical protein
MKRAYRVNGAEHEFDDEAKQWLSRILHQFFGDSSQRKP